MPTQTNEIDLNFQQKNTHTHTLSQEMNERQKYQRECEKEKKKTGNHTTTAKEVLVMRIELWNQEREYDRERTREDNTDNGQMTDFLVSKELTYLANVLYIHI